MSIKLCSTYRKVCHYLVLGSEEQFFCLIYNARLQDIFWKGERRAVRRESCGADKQEDFMKRGDMS